MRLTIRMGRIMHPHVPLYPIPDSSSKSKAKSDPGWWAGGDSSDEEVDYIPTGPEIEIPELEDSERDEVQILEPPPIPLVDLVTEDEEDSEEMEVLESLPVLVIDLGTNDEKELEPMDTSEDTEGELEMLAKFEKLTLSFEESRELVRTSGNRVRY
jgi:hypothetical protein